MLTLVIRPSVLYPHHQVLVEMVLMLSWEVEWDVSCGGVVREIGFASGWMAELVTYGTGKERIWIDVI